MSPSEFGSPTRREGAGGHPGGADRWPGRAHLRQQDLRWPSCAYVDAITARLRDHRFAHPVTALRYPDAGHFIGGLPAWYGSMTDDALTSDGGTVAGAQAAQADAHAKLLALLESQ